MAVRRPLYQNTAAKRFRDAIRPSLVGQIGRTEPRIAQRAAVELEQWLRDVIGTVMRETRLRDPKGEVAKQLREGLRVYGKSSLNSLRGVIFAYPWLFPHEFGGDIQPKEGKYLALPMYYGVRADGSPKFRNPRAWNRFGSFVYTNKKTGNKFLAYKHKETQELRILYLLIEEVRIPARLRLNITAERMSELLIGVWGQIYVEEATASGVINLWGRTQ